MLRNALFENYVPPSIVNLKINARVVFFALLALTIAWYVYSNNIYLQLKDNMLNIHSAKSRLMSLTDIGANTRALSALYLGRYGNKTSRSGRNYEIYKRE